MAYLNTMLFVSFESPFTQKTPANNRWIQLAENITRHDFIQVYNRKLNNNSTGASNINPRIVIGVPMVKHFLNLSHLDTIHVIQENYTIQHFLGFDNIIYDNPFNPSLLVEIRNQMGFGELEKMNDMIYRNSYYITRININ